MARSIAGERRRMAKYTPDNRGNVTVEWHAAPAAYSKADTPLSDTTRAG